MNKMLKAVALVSVVSCVSMMDVAAESQGVVVGVIGGVEFGGKQKISINKKGKDAMGELAKKSTNAPSGANATQEISKFAHHIADGLKKGAEIKTKSGTAGNVGVYVGYSVWEYGNGEMRVVARVGYGFGQNELKGAKKKDKEGENNATGGIKVLKLAEDKRSVTLGDGDKKDVKVQRGVSFAFGVDNVWYVGDSFGIGVSGTLEGEMKRLKMTGAGATIFAAGKLVLKKSEDSMPANDMRLGATDAGGSTITGGKDDENVRDICGIEAGADGVIKLGDGMKKSWTSLGMRLGVFGEYKATSNVVIRFGVNFKVPFTTKKIGNISVKDSCTFGLEGGVLYRF